jgi:Golgi phosphoprotein 3 (GPP34)
MAHDGAVETTESLPARLYLSAYDPTRNRLTGRGELGVLMRAAALTELLHAGRLRDANGRPEVVVAANGPLLAEIEASSRPRTWAHWVGRGEKVMWREVQDGLVAARLIRLEPRRILGIFPSTRVIVLDPMVVPRLHDAMNRTLRDHGPAERVDPRDAALVALAAAGGLRTAFNRKTAREYKSRVAELSTVAGPAVAAARKVIQARQAAAVSAG